MDFNKKALTVLVVGVTHGDYMEPKDQPNDKKIAAAAYRALSIEVSGNQRAFWGIGGIRNTEVLRAIGLMHVVDDFIFNKADEKNEENLPFMSDNENFRIDVLDEKGVLQKNMEYLPGCLEKHGKNSHGKVAGSFDDWLRLRLLGNAGQIVWRRELHQHELALLKQSRQIAAGYAKTAYTKGYFDTEGIRETGEEP